MKYIAFLRGINVGGNNLIKMTDLKLLTENCGLKNVSTFIQSGNIIFESNLTKTQQISTLLEEQIEKIFSMKVRVVTLSKKVLQQIVLHAPSDWKSKKDIRCYIAFLIPPLTTSEATKAINPKEDVDVLTTGTNVLYMTTLLSGLTKSGFSKFIGTSVYKNVTIRNFTTVQKILLKMS